MFPKTTFTQSTVHSISFRWCSGTHYRTYAMDTDAGQEECRKNNPSCKRKCWLSFYADGELQKTNSELPAELPKTGFGVARAVFELKSELPKVGVGVANGVAEDSFRSCQSCFWSYRRLFLELQKTVFGVTGDCFWSYRKLFLELQKAVLELQKPVFNGSCGLFFALNSPPPM